MIDTIVVVVMFVFPAIHQKENVKTSSEVMKKQLRVAFEEAGRVADEVTRKEQERLCNFIDMYKIMEELNGKNRKQIIIE